MYSNDEGKRQLDKYVQQYNAALQGKDPTRALYIDIVVSAPGILPPEPDNVATLNEIIPFMNIREVGEKCFVLRWYAVKSASFLGSAQAMERDSHCMEITIQLSLPFLTALSMATLSFASWRSLSIDKTQFSGRSLASNRGADFVVEPVPLTIENPTSARMHIGHFAAALQIHGELMQLHEKFLTCYEKAQILFSTPAHLKLNFCDEAYLNYFRCLEYLVMDRILDQKGNYSNYKLVDAFEKYKIQIGSITDRKQFLQFANKLDRQRDSAVAHLTRSNRDAPELTGQQVYELKTLIDALAFKHANYKLYGLPTEQTFPIHLPFGSNS